MLSAVRPFLTPLLLCAVLCIGHAPAWIHVSRCGHDHDALAMCSGHHHPQGAMHHESCSGSDSVGHHHGCTADSTCDVDALPGDPNSAPDASSTGATAADSSTRYQSDPPADPSDSHDSQNCPVCQSVFAPIGSVQTFDFFQASLVAGDGLVCRDVSIDVESPVFLPPSRGPPTASC
ncbi:hypothetical protein K227x_07140 [Rubripirellula lacrimiformis]|uniref:Uncharacterized protein n=1 Tax=Rubripirellula lacrimiformis TaxID=1930273 RepID=A0A517N5M6_9BACT|nr:hypothetical protein K227x_07140 [Rubripirellula lacrimiformis]